MKDLQELKATYDAAIAENTSMSEELIKERDKVVALMADLKKSNGDVSKFKSQLTALQNNMKVLTAENDNPCSYLGYITTNTMIN
jgi:predicted nuclease with TOPRIM domain